MDPVTFTTERLVMRQWRPEDRAPYFAINCEPAVLKHLTPLTREESDGMLERIDRHFAEHGWGLWALEERASGTLIGFCGLMHLRPHLPFTPAVEIGWRLSERWHGKGLALESAQRALRFGFEDVGLERIVAYTRPQNTPSWGLMVRLGMHRTLDFDHPNLPEGHPMRPHVLYEIRR